MSVAKVVQIIATSEKGWEDAAKTAVEEASKTVRHISGVHVISQTADVRDGKIISYKTTVNLVFQVER